MKIILIGFKGCGKSTIGKRLADKLKLKFADLDQIIEEEYYKRQGEQASFREIYNTLGEKGFRTIEKETLKKVLKDDKVVIALGGGTPLSEENQKMIEGNTIIHMKISKEQLYKQIMKKGIPAFFDKHDPRKSFEMLLSKREEVYEKIATKSVDLSGLTPEGAAELLSEEIA